MKKEKKKKLMLIVPNLMLGGQQAVFIKTVQLLKDDYEIFPVVFTKEEMAYKCNEDLINLNLPAQKGKLAKFITVIKRSVELKKIKEKNDIDYSFSFGMTANLANVLAKRKGTKLIISIHGMKSLKKSLLSRFVYHSAEMIVCTSKEMKSAVEREYGVKNVYYLYNPIDMQGCIKGSRENVDDYDFAENTIVTHGRLHEVKNHARLIKAFYLLKKELPDVKLLIIGEGEYREKTEKLIEEYDLQDDVKLIGFRANPFKYIAKSKLYVLTSISEGFCNSLVEGMSFLPAISADCKAGPREILTGGDGTGVAKEIEFAEYGILIPPASKENADTKINKDDEILASAMMNMLSNTEVYEKYKSRAKERAEFFSCEKYRKELINLLEG